LILHLVSSARRRLAGVACVALTLAFAAPDVAGQTLHVSPTGSDTTGDGTAQNPVRTITRAQTLATDGTTIRLAAGNYGGTTETITLTKTLTIVGAGIGQSVVQAATSGSRTVDGIAQRVVVLVRAPGRVEIRDLTVDGRNATSGGVPLTGVYWTEGADGALADCEVVGCRAQPIAAASDHAAVRVVGATTDAADVRLHDVVLREFAHSGLRIRGNAHVVADAVTIVGVGPLTATGPVQRGVHVTDDASVDIRASRIVDLWHSPAATTAAAIRLDGAGAGSRIDDNEITRCEVGVELRQSPTATRATLIRRNRITLGEVGIANVGTGGVLVVRNELHRLTTPATDDTAGNSWSDNGWSHWNGTGSVAIAGAGNNIDASPRRGFEPFATPIDIALGGVPVAFVAAALNGDARNDFAVAVESASPTARPRLVVALAQGATFTTATTTFAGIAAIPSAIAVGAFDGSAGLDVAIAVTDESRIYVRTNDGAGAFTALHDFALPAGAESPAGLAAADVDGDGDADLVVASRGPLIGPGGAWLLRNGGGGTSWTALALAPTFTRPCAAVTFFDFDGANGIDLAVLEGDTTSGRVHVLTNNGSGTFTPIASSPFTVGADPTAVAAGDFDRDGRVDLVVTCTRFALPPVAGSVHVLRNTGTGFVEATFDVGRLPVSVVVGDLDDDDDADTPRRDVVTVDAGDNALSWLAAHDSQAGFGAHMVGDGGTQPRAVVRTDADGDDRLDLVVADAGLDRLRILPASPRARADRFGIGCPGDAGRMPRIRPGGPTPSAQQPTTGFRVELAAAAPFSVGVLLAGRAAATTLAPCTVLLPGIDVSWIAFTNGIGGAQVPIVVPPTPVLTGATAYFQWAVLDPAGGFGAALALTDGLRVRVGR
jgi:hypothetical protein